MKPKERTCYMRSLTCHSVFLFLLLLAPFRKALPQHLYKDYNTRYTGELGWEAGAAQYFGDLNTHTSFRALKPALGMFYRYYFNDYIGASAHLHFAQLGYSDIYNSNEFEHRRNLSFNTNIWEFTIQGDFNFFQFEPGSMQYRFTPYLTFGAGLFSFNPYAYYHDDKYFLQPLGTEGQGSAQYPDRRKYDLWSYCIPLGMGVKYNVSRRVNVGLSAVHRFTGTDYLDDVSTTYAGAAAFPPDASGKQSIASLLQDRSYETGTPIGIAGRQRGNSKDKDQYLMIELSVSILFTSYRCPTY